MRRQRNYMSSSAESEKLFEAPEGKRPWYAHDGDWWLEIILVIIAGLFVEAYLEKNDFFLALRYKGYNAAQRLIPRVKTPPPRTAVLLVDDVEYWTTGDDFPGGHAPIPRTYLARLVAKVASLNPKVIALDFDLRTEHQQGQRNDSPGSKDVLALTGEINRLSSPADAPRVVLAKSLWKKDGAYVQGRDIYDGLIDPDRVDTGFIALPHQTWRMPFPVRTKDVREPLRPFSLATADALRIREGQTRISLPPGRVPFAPYRDISEWVGEGKSALFGSELPKNSSGNICNLHGDKQCRTVFASYLRAHSGDPAIGELFDGKIVLIGGDWHTRAEDQGERADRYVTPAGEIPGVLIHAAYIEGFRTYTLSAPTRRGEYTIRFVDLCLSLGFALLLASFERYPRRIRLERFFISLAKILTALLFIVVAYIASGVVVRAGYFFDFTVLAVIVVAHYAYDSVEWPWRKEEMDRDYTLLFLRWFGRSTVAATGRLRSAVTRTEPPASPPAPSPNPEPRVMQVGAGARPTSDSATELKTGTK